MSPRVGGLHRLLPLLLAAVLLGAAAFAAAARSPAEVQRIDRAIVRIGDAPAREVALPDTWAQRGVRDLRQPGHYRLGFELTALPDESMALMFTRLSTDHTVRVNGQLVSNVVQTAAGSNPGLPNPALLSVPPALLHVGHNTVQVEVRHAGSRAGLSPMQVGPMSALRQQHLHHELLYVTLPQAMNMATGGLALLLIAIWWRRRSEVALGSFGALSLLGSIRNYSYFVPSAVGSALHADWAFYAAQAWTLVLLAAFAQAFAGVRWPRYARTVLATAVALSVAGLVAMQLDRLPELRVLSYPLLLALALPALWLCLRHARARPVRSVVAQAVGVAAMLGAVAHDYAYQTIGLLPMTATFWLPYVMPLALAAVTLVLLRRMTAAMGEVEALNAELEARVAERTAELAQANEAKTRFLAAASHDLRQPLVTIGLLVGMARDDSSSHTTRQMLDRADQAVGAMENLLTGLLDLSRLESGVVRPRMADVRLAEVFASIAAHEQETAAHKGLRLRLRPTTAVVRSDAVMLERILRNLVANALRYTARGSVLVAARRRGSAVRIEVRDSGVGIAPQDQPGIYREFLRLDNPMRARSGGMGLGLSIVQRSADVLGHRVGLRSALGRGSCFWVDIDDAPGAAELPPARPAAAPAVPMQALDGLHVLLLDDDDSVRDALAERLRAWGAHVDACASLAALRRRVEAADARPPGLLLSDHHLPDGDGLDAIAAVRARFGPVPAVVMTADTAPAAHDALRASGLPVLRKPFRAEALLAAAGDALRG